MRSSLSSLGDTGKTNYSLSVRETDNGFVVRADTYSVGNSVCGGQTGKEYVCQDRVVLSEIVITLLEEMGILISEEEFCDECCSSGKCCN